jgi:hypothetical protein
MNGRAGEASQGSGGATEEAVAIRADLSMPKQEVTEPISKVAPVRVKHRPGTPWRVSCNMNLKAPGRIPGMDLHCGKSKLLLTAQDDPNENGIYRPGSVSRPPEGRRRRPEGGRLTDPGICCQSRT